MNYAMIQRYSRALNLIGRLLVHAEHYEDTRAESLIQQLRYDMAPSELQPLMAGYDAEGEEELEPVPPGRAPRALGGP